MRNAWVHDEIVPSQVKLRGRVPRFCEVTLVAMQPEGVKALAQEQRAEVQHARGTCLRPEHSGLFEPLAHDAFSARFDDTTADEPTRFATGAVVHPLLMPV
jgi:hypothetical protein